MTEPFAVAENEYLKAFQPESLSGQQLTAPEAHRWYLWLGETVREQAQPRQRVRCD